jgi:predicted aspartyl protease
MQIPISVKKIPPNGSHIFVTGKLNGIGLRFLIDTGASQSVIDKSFAQEHLSYVDIIKTEHQTTGLGANIPNSEFVKIYRIRIGKFDLKKMEFALLDLSVVNTAYASAGFKVVNAIIGGDILFRYRAIIDYSAKILHLSAS